VSVVASPISKSSAPETALIIDVDSSARTDATLEEVDSNAAPIPEPSKDEELISLATIPVPPTRVVTDVVVALDDAIVPKAVAPLATLLPADAVAVVVDAATLTVLAELEAAADPEATVAAVVVVEAVIPEPAVPPIAAECAATMDPPDVAAILPPDSAAVVEVVVVDVATDVAVVVAAIPPPSDKATAPPTAAAVVPTTPAVLVVLSLLTDAKKNGDCGSLFFGACAQKVIA
jgi:hypothetical protein